jgi:hypothetical protein
VAGLRTEFDFVLPKGFVDDDGTLHQRGTMRLATARDELEPLRDMRVSGPDDPLLTVIVLSRVITRLGTLPQITSHEIEGLFAVDLAYLQDFYGVINFGTDAEIEALLEAQAGASGGASASPDRGSGDGVPAAGAEGGGTSEPFSNESGSAGARRSRIEEVTSTER